MTSLHVVRLADAPCYVPPGHEAVTAVRHQGAEAGGESPVLVATSRYEPGAVAAVTAVPMDTVYLVTAGELSLSAPDTEETWTLAAGDSVYLPVGTRRELSNRADKAADIVVVTVPHSNQENRA